MRFIFALVFMFTLPSFAEEPVTAKPETKTEKQHSANVGYFGILSPIYGLNYEYLHGGTHGLVVEGTFETGSGDDSTYTYSSGSLGYRWHWRGKQNSGFLGVNGGYSMGSSDTKYEGSTYNLSMSTISVTPNIGKRWAFDSGLNVTWRVGIGYASRSVTTDDDSDGAQEAVKLLEDVINFLPVGMESELSIGWAF